MINASTKKGKLRCAIYTRKSTSEGLDAEITSLDVQRQAGEAYIQSQAQDIPALSASLGEFEKPGIPARKESNRPAGPRTRERQTGAHIPIIAMTAHAMKGDRERCLEAGMDAYIAKPIHVKEVFETIETVLDASTELSDPPDGSPSEEEVVDWSEALSAVKGDRELLRTVVDAALEEIPRLMTTIRQAVTTGDAGSLRLAAHTLKGAIRYFHARWGFEHTCRLESMGREGNLEGAKETLTDLEREMERVTPLLSDYVRQK